MNQDFLKITRGTSLFDVVGEPDPDAFLSSSVYKVGQGVYLTLSAFKPSGLERAAEPNVVGTLWAPDDGAVRRALLMDVEADNGAIAAPPPTFLPSPDVRANYGAIFDSLKGGKPRVLQEFAAYRIATDGRFIHRVIETERCCYYFRGARDDDAEAPYAIVQKAL